MLSSEMPRLCTALLLVSTAQANFYDVLQPHLHPPDGGCKDWSDVPEMDKHWVSGKPPAGAGSSCAQQGLGNPAASWHPDMGTGEQAHTTASYCVSKTSGAIAACTSGQGIPEQVNVQVANADSVVIGFVTFEQDAPTAPPVASFSAKSTFGEANREVKGVTHSHQPCKGGFNGSSCIGGPYDRPPYFMHYVKLGNLDPRATYSYKVKSGAAAAVWSDTFTFRAPYSDGVTKIALYGDMGVYTWNNMQNLYEVLSQYRHDLIIISLYCITYRTSYYRRTSS
jgi:hypothetical protein